MNAIEDALKTIGETFCWDVEHGERQRRLVREKLQAIAKQARREALLHATNILCTASREIESCLRWMRKETR